MSSTMARSPCGSNADTLGPPLRDVHRVDPHNGRFRDEYLNEHWFLSLAHTRQIVEAWRLDYNAVRPPSALGNVSPTQFEPCMHS